MKFTTLIFQVFRDGEHPPGHHRGQQAEGGHSGGGQQDLPVQVGEPDHVRVGDQGQAGGREGVRQRQRAFRQFDK